MDGISEDIKGNRDRYLAVMHDHGAMMSDSIVASLTESQTELHSVFSSASVEQAGLKPADDEWSLLELARHAFFTERLIAKLVHHLARGEFPSAEDLEGAGIGMMPPSDDRPYPDVLDDLLAKSAAILAAVRNLPEDANPDFKAPHPYFGPLNSKEWAGFQRVHDLDHIQHARKILAAL